MDASRSIRYNSSIIINLTGTFSGGIDLIKLTLRNSGSALLIDCLLNRRLGDDR